MGTEPKTVFALDTGTRSVVGLVLEIGLECSRVIAIAREEHQGRAMLDGQIHDVNRVADVVIRVKQQLEKKLGSSLRRVAVAAAGRALITKREKFEHSISPWDEIREEEVRRLELEAIRVAEQSLAQSKEGKDKYYCVGYSVVGYFLDGEVIGNPAGQRGKLLGIDLIATFLPQVVVDSLIAVLERAGLEIEILTLEPIAALEYIIPPTMRQLNLVLVDIGAGTSDIAITAGGSVTAFAMVPLAGDEVTEKLCGLYLLDFMVGEKVKRKLREKEIITFKDILGVQHKVSSKEIIASLRETIQEIARHIGETILELNQGPPQAVLCIGGGSLTPCLTEELALSLSLPKQRVAVRGSEGVSRLEGLTRNLAGPEGVTPLGIAIMAARPQALSLSQVQVNGKSVRFFRGENANVGDALLAAGIGFTELVGQPGLPLTVEVNGKISVIKGKMGQPAEIFLNGVPASLDTALTPDAIIEVGEAKPGPDATALVKDVLPPELPTIKIFYNGLPKILGPLVFVNGEPATPETPLEDHARVSWRAVRTVSDALSGLGFSESQLLPRILKFTLNGKPKEISYFSFKIYRNHELAKLEDEILDGDELVYDSSPLSYQIKHLLMQERVHEFPQKEIKVFVNGECITLTLGVRRILKNGTEVNLEEEVRDGDDIRVVRETVENPILADIFKYISFEEKPSQAAARLVMLINGQEAQFTTPLKHGDKIRIYWKDE
ncbi:MAG: rod shape-determining protein [Bacillota bacterium]|nr:rod shape-determining protein [Bacillota bacterium]